MNALRTANPIYVYAAVLDGSSPEDWRPFGESGPELRSIMSKLQAFEAAPLNPSLGSVRFGYITTGVDELEATDTTQIVAVLVDGTRFTGKAGCSELERCQEQLRDLCTKLASRRDGLWSLYGLRIWLVASESQHLQPSVVYKLAEPIKAALTLEPGRHLVERAEVIEFVAKDTAIEVAQKSPFVGLRS